MLNLIGLAAPLPMAVMVLPALLAGLGHEGLSLLALYWALASYSSVLDLGVSRALTQRLAVAIARLEAAQLIATLWSSALVALLVVGLVAGLVLFVSANTLVEMLELKGDAGLAAEGFRILALAIPIGLIGAACRGTLEACHEFGLINAIRVPLGLWTFAGPWFAVKLGHADLATMAWLMLWGRAIATVVSICLALRVLPAQAREFRVNSQCIYSLLRSGFWLTLGNLVGPVMGYADRFIVAGLASTMAAVYYSTPQELVLKLWILPGALMAALFPTLAGQLASRDKNISKTFEVSVRWISMACLPIALLLALGAPELLSYWLGDSFSSEATPVLRWMAFGMFFACLGQLPFTLLQSADLSDLTAKLHLIQLPAFLFALVLMVPTFGVAGGAAVWAVRNMVDAVCLFLICRAKFRGVIDMPVVGIGGAMLVCAASFGGVMLDTGRARGFWMGLALLAFCYYFWPRRDLFRFD